MPSHWPRNSLVVELILVAIVVVVIVAWALWPVQCDHNAIGFEAEQPDPNLHACSTRVGTIVSLDAARVSAIIWGEAAGGSLLLTGSVAARVAVGASAGATGHAQMVRRDPRGTLILELAVL